MDTYSVFDEKSGRAARQGLVTSWEDKHEEMLVTCLWVDLRHRLTARSDEAAVLSILSLHAGREPCDDKRDPPFVLQTD